jgi:hypothetical protein
VPVSGPVRKRALKVVPGISASPQAHQRQAGEDGACAADDDGESCHGGVEVPERGCGAESEHGHCTAEYVITYRVLMIWAWRAAST